MMIRRALIIVWLAACGGARETTVAPAITPSKDAIVKTTENGPVKATIAVWPPKPSLGDAIYARLEITAPAGVTIEAPFQQAGDETLGRFKVVGFTRDTRHDATGGSVHEQLYTLEAPSSGRHRLPPLRLEMLDTRSSAPASMGSGSATRSQEILTEEIPLEVQPIATEALGAELRPAAGQLGTTVGGMSWMLILGLASGLAVLLSGGVLGYRAYVAKRRIANQRSAYE
nr:hypothetical protein [Deltaproteobacteria bacterium]